MAELLILVESNTTGSGRLFAERARDLGLVPHLVTADPTRYPYAAELDLPVHRCDTGSPPAVLACCRGLAQAHRVAGVTSSSEYFIATAAAVARALDVPGEEPERLAAARSKGVQRERFAAAGVASPGYQVVTSVPAALAAAQRLGLPVVVKPVSRSGSIGVRRCDDPRMVATHAAELLATRTDERGLPLPAAVLVECYLSGPEFSVELLAGEVRAVVAKHVDESRGFLEVGHDVPAAVAPGTATLLGESARAALAALGLGWGAAHVELRMTDGRAVVVELNPRLAGGMIPQAIRVATGQDLIAELVARSAGRVPPQGTVRTGYASVRFLLPAADGVVGTLPDPASALALPGVVDAVVTARPGQRIVRLGSFLDRLGYVIAQGRSPAEAGARADRAVAALPVAID
ncbi:ATP-grasp domain-containing protein [Micromonospora sp. NPDC049891]|uniref:ATP-grasp domain-containing protein n=1 Tax=Micromonospora sp. NPDC049891 TaxID=3155655 RepID=UPI003400E436